VQYLLGHEGEGITILQKPETPYTKIYNFITRLIKTSVTMP
jgi:hypothetical protein